MADDKGRAVSTELAPSPTAHAPTRADKPKNCVACGHYHGSEGMGRICLENEVHRLRRMLADFPAQAAELRRYRGAEARVELVANAILTERKVTVAWLRSRTPDWAPEFAADAIERGQHIVDAAVSGRPGGPREIPPA